MTKIVLTCIGGVLIAALGAFLKYLFDQISAMKMEMSEELQKFSLPKAFGDAPGGDSLHVSWKGNTYESLSRVTYRLRNAGRADIPPSEFIVEFPHGKDRYLTNVVETSSVTAPVVGKVVEAQISKEGDGSRLRYVFKIPLLEKNDTVEVNLLFDGADPVYYQPRGTGGAKIRLTREGRSSTAMLSAVAAMTLVSAIQLLRELSYKMLGLEVLEFFLRIIFMTVAIAAFGWIATELSNISKALGPARRKR